MPEAKNDASRILRDPREPKYVRSVAPVGKITKDRNHSWITQDRINTNVKIHPLRKEPFEQPKVERLDDYRRDAPVIRKFENIAPDRRKFEQIIPLKNNTDQPYQPYRSLPRANFINPVRRTGISIVAPEKSAAFPIKKHRVHFQ